LKVPLSVADLAFQNMSTDAENEFFADGISEEILNLLADVSGLSVASRTSAFAYTSKTLPSHGAVDRCRDRPPPVV
jgi:TolB-like protein